jgi:hypothetical protein
VSIISVAEIQEGVSLAQNRRHHSVTANARCSRARDSFLSRQAFPGGSFDLPP